MKGKKGQKGRRGPRGFKGMKGQKGQKGIHLKLNNWACTFFELQVTFRHLVSSSVSYF